MQSTTRNTPPSGASADEDNRAAITRHIRNVQTAFQSSLPQYIEQVLKDRGCFKSSDRIWAAEEGGIYKQLNVQALSKIVSHEVQHQFEQKIKNMESRLRAVTQGQTREKLKQFCDQQIQRALAAKVDTDASIHRAINDIPESKDFPASLDTISGVFANNHDGKLYTIDGFGISVVTERPKQLFARQSLTLNLKSVPTVTLQRHNADDLQILIGTKLLANRGPSAAAIRLTGNSQSFLRILKSVADTHGTCVKGARLVIADAAIPCAESVSALVIVSGSTRLSEHWTVWTFPVPTSIRTESDMIDWLVAGALCQRPIFSPSRSLPPAVPNTLPVISTLMKSLPSNAQETGTTSILHIDAEKPNVSAAARKGDLLLPADIHDAVTLAEAVSQIVDYNRWQTNGGDTDLRRVFLSPLTKQLKQHYKMNSKTCAFVITQELISFTLRSLGFQVKRPANRMCVEVFVSSPSPQ